MELTPELAKKNILIVEDAISMRHMVKAALRTNGFNSLIEAGDGEKALKVLELYFVRNEAIDLIVCDWVMPNMSGLDLFKTIQKEDKYKNIPFILLTGNDQKDSITEALQAGIKNYIVKPFNPLKLFEKVRALLQEQEQMQLEANTG